MTAVIDERAMANDKSEIDHGPNENRENAKETEENRNARLSVLCHCQLLSELKKLFK